MFDWLVTLLNQLTYWLSQVFPFIDYEFMVNRVYPVLNRGLNMTLKLLLPSITIGTTLGIALGVVRVFGTRGVRLLANGLVGLIRGVPLTVQLMILYFGLPYVGILFDPYPAAVLGFILCTGAYQSEYVRGALLGIRQGQIKAAEALGMSKLKTIISVVIPQAVRRALPGCGNEIIYLIKYSSLAYVVTCVELTGEAKTLFSRTFRPVEVYTTAACYYLFMVSIATMILHRLEKRFAIPGFDKPLN